MEPITSATITAVLWPPSSSSSPSFSSSPSLRDAGIGSVLVAVAESKRYVHLKNKWF